MCELCLAFQADKRNDYPEEPLHNHSILCAMSAVKLLNIVDFHEVWYNVYTF